MSAKDSPALLRVWAIVDLRDANPHEAAVDASDRAALYYAAKTREGVVFEESPLLQDGCADAWAEGPAEEVLVLLAELAQDGREYHVDVSDPEALEQVAGAPGVVSAEHHNLF
jgi:hypothetical protein